MLEALILQNFKSIKYGKFDLEQLTLFCGLNGMGKSSALQSLLLMRQSFEQHVLPHEGLSLAGEYVRMGTGKDLLYTDADIEQVEISIDWKDSFIKGIFEYCEKSDLQPLVAGKMELDGSPFNESLFTSNFQYLSAERISPKSIYDVSEYAVNQKRSLGTKGQYTAHFLAEHGNDPISIKSLLHPEASTPTLIDNVNAWMSLITPGTKVLAKLLPEINQASLHYQFASSSELTAPFRPENTGFGLTYVLPVVTAVLSAHAGDLLLIENPESHLHPAGQSLIAKLISLAAQGGVQILVETHSDHFLNGIRIAVRTGLLESKNMSAYFLSRDQDKAEHSVNIDAVRIDESGTPNSWPTGFFDEWDKSLSQLIKDL